MKCANCGKLIRKHDDKEVKECLELTSLELLAQKVKIERVVKSMKKTEKKITKLEEKLKDETN